MPVAKYFAWLESVTVAAIVIACAAMYADEAGTPGAAPVTLPAGAKSPQNVIFFVGDGAGYNHVAAASIFRHGVPGMQTHEKFPVRLGVSTYSASGAGYRPDSAWTFFDYVKKRPTDSAAAATALSTGVSTTNGALGVDAQGQPVENVIERAEALGKATGVVTSVQFTHATPAGFVVHNASRGATAAIAREMILDSRVDVVMGAGHPFYDAAGTHVDSADYTYVGGRAVWDNLVAGRDAVEGNPIEDADGDGTIDRWTLIEAREQFLGLVRGATPKRVIGVPRVRTTLQQARPGDGNAAPYTVPINDATPTLVEMTRAALNVLDDDPDGFFLMIEGGAIDWASHANQSGRMIEEAADFGYAIDAVVAWVNTHGGWDRNLVIVTGDHETGYLWGPGSGPDPTDPSRAVFNPIANNGRGRLPGMQWYLTGHTNSLIPFFAKGAGSESFAAAADEVDPRRGPYLHNAEIARVLFALWPRKEE